MEEENTDGVKTAILVRGLSKQYGKEIKVLDNLDMTVIKGTIYGLLGASGCGKTTLLGAILGTRIIQKGSISILEEPPGVVPVKSIGYMPQDIALVEEFTVKQVLQHQGWIFGKTNEQIRESHKFYEKLLDLPPANKLIKELSGGQQRRVSLAVVLIQDPELLILDEPTVGLDPILRQNLWDYLIKLTEKKKKTVVITTHYIEEARQANVVGLLRHGKMLAEGEPDVLMSQHNCSSLENLFLSLSSVQEERGTSSNPQQQNFIIPKSQELEILNQIPPKKSLLQKILFTNRGNAKALLSKNCIKYVRNPGTLCIALILPVVQIVAMYIAVGRIPSDLSIGIVNEELGEYKNCENYVSQNNSIGGFLIDEYKTCEYRGLGCKFADIMKNVTQNQIYYDSIEEALKAVKAGKIHQVLHFQYNYSEAFTIVNNFVDAEIEDINFSKITFYRDEADNPLVLHVEKELHYAYEKFAEELADDCQWTKGSEKLPMVFNEPIYGTTSFTYSDSLGPGNMVINLLTLAQALAITTITSERTGGVWERTIVSGIQPAEILIFHTITLSFTTFLQTSVSFFLGYYILDFECKGNLMYAFVLLYLEAIIGVAMGIMYSVLSRSEGEAIFLAFGSALPFLVLSGYVWPLEAMPKFLQYMSSALPTTIPIESLNNIAFRGWAISNFNVYKGYLVSIGYICFLFILSVLGLKFKKK